MQELINRFFAFSDEQKKYFIIAPGIWRMSQKKKGMESIG